MGVLGAPGISDWSQQGTSHSHPFGRDELSCPQGWINGCPRPQLCPHPLSLHWATHDTYHSSENKP